MSDNIIKDDQQLDISDVDLAKIAAALIGVEYPGDEYFDGTKQIDNQSSVKVVKVEESIENIPEKSEETLLEVDRAERTRSTPFRKQSFSAWQSARLRNFAKAGIIDTTEPTTDNEEVVSQVEPLPLVEEGVITISDILGDDAQSFDHEPDLTDVEENDNQDLLYTEPIKPYDIEEEYGALTESEQEMSLDEIEGEVIVDDASQIDTGEIETDEIVDIEEENVESDFALVSDEQEIDQVSQNSVYVAPIIVPNIDNDENIATQKEDNDIDETSVEVDNVADETHENTEIKAQVEEIQKPKKVKRVKPIVEDIREITVCEKKNKPSATAPVMPEITFEKPTYFAYLETKPKKIRKTGNAPHLIPKDSEPVEFTPKGGKYREI